MSEEKEEGGCLFCRIVSGEIPSKKVYEDANTFAFLDINPRNPGHTLVIPKKHYSTLFDMGEKDVGRLFESVKLVAEAVRKGSGADGLSLIQSNGKAAGQVVSHLHVHLIPRFMNEGPVSPEAILAPKKMPEQVLDKLASAIKDKMRPQRDSGEIKFDF